MCGDGTNDVGALKAASVGVALVSVSKRASASRRRAKAKSKQPEWGHASAAPLVRLGDASLAAPFTSRIPSVASCVHVVRQGRSALTTSLQLFKILGISCLVSAFSLSRQYLEGVRSSDNQQMVLGVIVTVLYMLLALAKPAESLAPQKAHASVFSAYAMLSISAQFLCHLALLVCAVGAAKRLTPDLAPGIEPPHPDADFSPSLVNTASFLAGLAALCCTFCVNYAGEPFSQPLRSHTPLAAALGGGYLLLLTLSANAWPDLGAALELTAVPEELHSVLFAGAVVDLALCACAEAAARRAFPERLIEAAILLSPGT
jgi:cation-transporting ATPase 13A1